MTTDQNGPSKGKRTVTIREVPLDDWDALERLRLKLRLPREQFGRTLIHLAVWGAPKLFERAMREALGPEEPAEDAPYEEAES